MAIDPGLAGILGGLIGAVAGATASHYLAKPKPEIHIKDIFLDPMQSDDERAIARDVFRGKAKNYFLTSEDLYQLSRLVPYVKSAERLYQHPQQYTMWLYTVNRDGQKAVITHKQMPKVIKDLRGALNTNVLSEYYSLWESYDYVLIPHLCKSRIDGKFNLDGDAFEDVKNKNIALNHPVSVDEDGDFIVHVDNTKISVNWSSNKQFKDLLQPFCERIAVAIAKDDSSSLAKIQDQLERIDCEDAKLTQLLGMVSEELKNMSRVVVRGVISNNGRTPVSISGGCSLSLSSGNFSYISDDSQDSNIIKTDIDISMLLVDDGLIQPVNSLQIEGGGVVPFIAVSESYLSQMTNSRDISALYGSNRKSVLKFERLDNEQEIHSKGRLFRK